MVLFSIKKIENEIINRSITPKQFIIYSFFVISPIFSLLKTSRYPVNIEAYNLAFILSFIPIMINLVKYIWCYNIVKNKAIFLYLYSIIPISFILRLRYFIFLMLPLVIININLIKYFNLDFNYWNVVNSQLITIVTEIFIFMNFIIIIKRLYKRL
jgi:hypothetical protein